MALTGYSSAHPLSRHCTLYMYSTLQSVCPHWRDKQIGKILNYFNICIHTFLLLLFMYSGCNSLHCSGFHNLSKSIPLTSQFLTIKRLQIKCIYITILKNIWICQQYINIPKLSLVECTHFTFNVGIFQIGPYGDPKPCNLL